MLPNRSAVLLSNKGQKLRIRQGHSLSAAERAVQRSFQRVGHILNGFPVGDVELGILGCQIQIKCSGNDRIIERSNGAGHIFDDLGGGPHRLRAVCLIVGGCPGTGDLAI